MKAQLFFHFWGYYTETLAILAPKEEEQDIVNFLTKECPLSEPVGTPSSGRVKSQGWIATGRGIVARYSGTDVEKVNDFLKNRLGAPKNCASMKKSIDKGGMFEITFPKLDNADLRTVIKLLATPSH